jgi:hypothetical protein
MMKKWALIQSGVVYNITDENPVGRYHPSLLWVECGDDVSPGWSFLNGALAAPIAKPPSIGEIWGNIKAERDRRKVGGFLVGDKWFHSDPESLIRYLGLIQLGSNLPPRNWKVMGGSFVPMSQLLAGNIFAAAVAHDAACFDAAEAHKAAMEASADPASYDFSVGWPLIFGE